MKQETRGLEAGSLFKFCFIGLFFFGIGMGLIGTIGGYLSPEDWNGPEGVSEFELTINNETISSEEVNTSNGMSDLFAFLLILPITSAISAAMIWVFLLAGQYLYTLLKPITLEITNKGLSFRSSVRLCVISWFFSWVPFTLISAILGIVETGELKSITISGEPLGVGIAILLSSVFIPLLGVLCGLILGVSMYAGQRLFAFIKPIKLVAIEYSSVAAK